MLDITLNEVVEHYAPDLIEQTKAFEKGAYRTPFLDAIHNRWGVTPNREYLSHMRIDDPKTGKFLAHNILFRELMESTSNFEQTNFIQFTTDILEKALDIREGPDNRSIWGMYKSEAFMNALSIQAKISEKDLRYLISALRANAVLNAQTNPDLMDNFFKCQIAYIQDYKQLPPTIQKKICPITAI